MNTKVQYNTLEEREEFLNKYKHLHLIEEHNLIEGNFLVFSDTPPQPPIVYVHVPEEEFEELATQNTNLMIAIAEIAEADVIEKTEIRLAIAELAEIISGGA